MKYMFTLKIQKLYAVYMHKKLRHKLLFKLSVVWLLLIIVGSAAIGMFVLYGLQNSGSIIDNLLKQKIAEQDLNQQSLQLAKIRSEKLGYELTYNPQIFKTDRATNTANTDLPKTHCKRDLE